MIEATANTLAVIGVAAFAGVMICIGVTLGGYWTSLQPEEFLAWFERNNRYVARSVPITVVPAAVGLAGSIVASWDDSELWLWLAGALCFGAVLVLTVRYFVPANNRFASGRVDVGEVPARLRRWLMVHSIRIALATAAAVFGCVAMQG